MAIAAAATVVLAAASMAWACSVQSSVMFRNSHGTSSSSYGPAGSGVTLEGTGWREGSVEVRWNSAAGELLARPAAGPDGSFSVAVTIPGQAKPGVYTIYFVQPAPTRDVSQQVARASYEVTPSDSSSPAPNGGGSGGAPAHQNSSSTSGTESQSSSGGGRSDASTSGGRSTSGSGSSAPSEGGTHSFAGPPPRSAPGSQPEPVGQPADQPAGRVTTAAPATDRSGAVATSGGQAVFAGSLATTSAQPATPPAPGDERVVAGPAATSVSGDLYSGFASGGDASLLPDFDATPAAGGPAPAALGVGLLGLSLVALFGGFAAAEARRRKAVVSRVS